MPIPFGYLKHGRAQLKLALDGTSAHKASPAVVSLNDGVIVVVVVVLVLVALAQRKMNSGLFISHLLIFFSVVFFHRLFLFINIVSPTSRGRKREGVCWIWLAP
jgi:hypothetical protein